jgi:hypothetical protein
MILLLKKELNLGNITAKDTKKVLRKVKKQE